MKEKVTQAASDTLGENERNAIEDELDALSSEIDDIVSETTFNGVALLSDVDKTIQTGEATTDTLKISVTTQDHTASALTVADSNVTVSSSSFATSSLTNVNNAITAVKNSISSIGSYQSRLSTKEATLSTAITNTEASRSRIMDADFAKEQLSALKLQIMQQTATASLAQANAAPQVVLSLFG
jgi:flagellin